MGRPPDDLRQHGVGETRPQPRSVYGGPREPYSEELAVVQPAGRSTTGQRSDDQVASERAMSEVSDVLLTIDHALDRAKRAHKVVAKDAEDRNAELALAETVSHLKSLKKRLVEDTYYTGDSLRLL